jgi:hypothetical protein
MKLGIKTNDKFYSIILFFLHLLAFNMDRGILPVRILFDATDPLYE